MNFMNETSANLADQIVRRPDGSIDREHYEIKARRERAKAFAQMLARIGGILFGQRGPRRPPARYREA